MAGWKISEALSLLDYSTLLLLPSVDGSAAPFDEARPKTCTPRLSGKFAYRIVDTTPGFDPHPPGRPLLEPPLAGLQQETAVVRTIMHGAPQIHATAPPQTP